MCIKGKFAKIFIALLFAGIAINLSMVGMDSAVKHNELERKISCFPTNEPAPPSSYVFSEFNETASNPLAYLFQLIFILFFISPPIIAVLLFLIWKELKERNKLK